MRGGQGVPEPALVDVKQGPGPPSEADVKSAVNIEV